MTVLAGSWISNFEKHLANESPPLAADALQELEKAGCDRRVIVQRLEAYSLGVEDYFFISDPAFYARERKNLKKFDRMAKELLVFLDSKNSPFGPNDPATGHEPWPFVSALRKQVVLG
jgi:hypothetical protein